jgi:hypothetical protein
MGIGIGGIGHVVIDDVGYLLDVYAAGDDVRCHQDVKSAIAKALHSPVPRSLGHVSLDSDGVQTPVFELPGKAGGSVLGARKDDRREEGGVLEKMLEQVQLSFLLNGIERVRDGLGGL